MLATTEAVLSANTARELGHRFLQPGLSPRRRQLLRGANTDAI